MKSLRALVPAGLAYGFFGLQFLLKAWVPTMIVIGLIRGTIRLRYLFWPWCVLILAFAA